MRSSLADASRALTRHLRMRCFFETSQTSYHLPHAEVRPFGSLEASAAHRNLHYLTLGSFQRQADLLEPGHEPDSIQPAQITNSSRAGHAVTAEHFPVVVAEQWRRGVY